MQDRTFDVAVIGGGIAGAAIARDAAGRGLSVFLCDEGDLGEGTSAGSDKLVHGALHLMEGFRLGAMREVVAEREIMMRAAPHLVRPLEFHIPHHERQWSQFAFRLGLFAFDHVAHHSLPPARLIDLEAERAHGPLFHHFALAFAYTDCVADDGRLIVLNAIDARARGATIATRLRCTVAERDGARWRLSLESADTGERSVATARILINAAGAAAGNVLNHVVHSRQRARIRMTKSSYLVVRRVDVDAVAYALPGADGGIVYAVPYEAGTMLVGPVVTDYFGDPASAGVDEEEVVNLLEVVAQYFHTPVEPADVVACFAGVKALPDDPAAVRRGRAVLVDAPPKVAPVISVFGGTLATHRLLAEQVVDRIGRFRSLPPPWTATAVLPGGGYPRSEEPNLVRALRAGYPFLSQALAARLIKAYGTRATAVVNGARSPADLGVGFGADLTPAEVDYLRHEEWAETAEDVLWRRTKLGLSLSAAEARGLAISLAVRSPVPVIPGQAAFSLPKSRATAPSPERAPAYNR